MGLSVKWENWRFKKRLGYFGDIEAKEKCVSESYEVNLCFIILKEKKNEDRKASIRFSTH